MIRERLGRQQDRSIRWIPSENLHITLWFLGEVREERCDAVVDSLRPRIAERSFRVQLSGVGTFPPSGSPRVLWLGVRDGQHALARVHAEIGKRLVPLGFAAESRPYSAHLTLARVKEPLPVAVRRSFRDAMQSVEASAGGWIVDKLTVFRSRTAPTGAVYEPLLRVPLS